ANTSSQASARRGISPVVPKLPTAREILRRLRSPRDDARQVPSTSAASNLTGCEYHRIFIPIGPNDSLLPCRRHCHRAPGVHWRAVLSRGTVVARITARPARAKTDDYAHQLYYQDSDFQTVDRITEVARQSGVSNAQIALTWLLVQPGVTAPIIWRQQARAIGRSGQGGE